MFWNRKSKDVGEHIAQVASVAGDGDEVSRRAQAAATSLGRQAIAKSRAYFWTPPPKPRGFENRFHGLGEWMSMCQSAIFEIWFHLGDAALEDLRSVAFGAYDWTQAHATTVLCRLALDGIETQRSAEQIALALPGWRYEQVMRVCGRVGQLAARSEVLQRAYDTLTDGYRDDDPVAAFELIAAAAPWRPGDARARYGDFLRDLMGGAGLEGRTAFNDGHVVTSADGNALVAKGGPTYPQVDDFHRIRAALLLHELLPDDAEVTARLGMWAADHPDEDVRQQLRQILSP